MTAHVSISLDGFIAGPGQSMDNPIGVGGARLHEWHWQADEPGHEADAGARDDLLRRRGAYVMGPQHVRAGPRAVGHRLARAYWHQGLATEGAKALVAEAIGILELDWVFAQTMAVNVASRNVMERAGLRYVRTFHQHFEDPIPGTEYGEVEYELRREDWPLIGE